MQGMPFSIAPQLRDVHSPQPTTQPKLNNFMAATRGFETARDLCTKPESVLPEKDKENHPPSQHKDLHEELKQLTDSYIPPAQAPTSKASDLHVSEFEKRHFSVTDKHQNLSMFMLDEQ